ncbi:MAG: Maf family protein [Dethiobacteria bacterium]
MEKLILASASPRRAQLLAQIGLKFLVVKSDFLETEVCCEGDVESMALGKARRVARDFPGRFVLGADTAVFCGEKVLGKPGDSREAVEMLKSLSGRVHSVVTGFALIKDNREITGREKTFVKMCSLGDEEIAAYVSSGEPMDKAGAYGIQGRGAIFVESIEGCFFNVVGLPLARLALVLKLEGFPIWG